MSTQPIRVLVAKPGLDGHDRGALVIAQALRDEGMEVIYTGLRQTPEQIVHSAIQEDVDVIGLSILSGAHNELVPEVMRLLKENEAEDICVVVGGVIPEEDIPYLESLGVKRVFTPGTSTQEVAQFIRQHVKPQSNLLVKAQPPRKMAHLGIAVKNLEEAIAVYAKLGFQLESQETVESEGVKVAFLTLGESHVELLAPLHPQSPIAKFIEKRGEGIHHLAIEVDDIETQLASYQAQGIQLIDEKPKAGAHQTRVAFVHPRSTHGVLLELCQPAH
ncbi:MAG: methylmalonyl-CoA epimerase [Bacillus thermozeamaize]|jgi:methylmalonyl-CoA mutase C-terminal domain/subunit|uniref:Methylmalonyl-CoA epimerase n=1 Tax=Bacillus thermozeamaize TaxID=230954 RepID=A0A1Y3PBW8_9BACI|nr:MAG: methylmalonyl-CoA epimerase [Bacillus thermozeamaize]